MNSKAGYTGTEQLSLLGKDPWQAAREEALKGIDLFGVRKQR
ncbi:hypothetical protein SAMN05192553_103689 [Cyclobacterium xiamenense]|uniref:Uncharacterized protein n=1 Tax=Cyclobacterium xiamenense TaxID=1297121 RepID=A0A1H6YJM2_9BACT|nr:hypothetical protein [Cyclobacterium xiamenense]SEJ40034.1 hypothetical protein SAMN05192553_103689 [Cyclobacterium xiamenense]